MERKAWKGRIKPGFEQEYNIAYSGEELTNWLLSHKKEIKAVD